MAAELDDAGVSLSTDIPLVVDLDGTLLCTDLLLETGMAFIKRRPLNFYKPLIWLVKSKASLKEALATRTNIDVTVLPYDQDVIELIKTARSDGRRVVLATASHYTLADRIAEYLQLFDQVLATDSKGNLSAHCKRDLLVKHYGEQGFDYAGNSHDDIPVWESARRAYVINPGKGVERRALSLGNVEKVIRSNTPALNDWLKALRLHQWMKNLLIFVPLLASHQLTNPLLLWQGILGFIVFGLCASSVYLLNDLLDLADDRRHHIKRHRPFAAGRLSIKSGLIACPILLAISFTASFLLLPLPFAEVLAGYYALTLAYSLALKRLMTVDVIVLAILYTVRIIAGAALFELELTFWILAFSMFMFLSLALVKRCAELRGAQSNGHEEQTLGRGYFPSDIGMISSLGASTGYISVMVLAMYIQDETATGLYTSPQVIWLACPLLLFWITRVWMLVHRGQMNDDPVVFAIRDRVSLVVGGLFCLVFWVAV